MGAPDGDGERTDAGLYRGILEEMVRGLPKEHRTGGVARLAGVVRRVYRDAGVDPPAWVGEVLPPREQG